MTTMKDILDGLNEEPTEQQTLEDLADEVKANELEDIEEELFYKVMENEEWVAEIVADYVELVSKDIFILKQQKEKDS